MIWWWPLLWWWCTAAGAVQDCEEARMRCAYRASCARALHSYMVDCADVLAGRTARCPWSCRRALIQLASSEAGLALSACECGDNEFCRRSKERAEVCRAEVSAAVAEGTVVPCAVAEWICAADHLCSTALGYYHRLCRPMFLGRKCTPRCNNSLAILDRQPKAGKLRTCYCDGSEDFPCPAIKRNTQKLCYGRDEWTNDLDNLIPYKPDADSGGGTAPPCVLLCALLCSFALWTSSEDSFTGIFLSPNTKTDSSKSIKNTTRLFSKVSWMNVALKNILNIHKHFFWTFDWTIRTIQAIRIFLSSSTKTDSSFSSRAVKDTARLFGQMKWIHVVRSTLVALKKFLNVHKLFRWTRAINNWNFRIIRAIRIFLSSSTKADWGYSSRAVKNTNRLFCKVNMIHVARHSAEVAPKIIFNIHKHFYWTREISDWTFRTNKAMMVRSTLMLNFKNKFVSCLKVHHSPVWYFILKGLSLTTWPWWWTSERLEKLES